MECEVSKNTIKKCNNCDFKFFNYIQDNYCALVNFECPSEDDFNDFDTNQDEILTWDEYWAGLA